jgi:hypothetical protein
MQIEHKKNLFVFLKIHKAQNISVPSNLFDNKIFVPEEGFFTNFRLKQKDAKLKQKYLGEIAREKKLFISHLFSKK